MTKPSKPTPDFPLYAHRSGQWAKKINGRTHYFGPWDAPQAAMRQYNGWLEGKKPPPPAKKQTKKPHPDFPLTAHKNGQWVKKVRGKLHYFGPIGDPQAALDKWNYEKEWLLAGKAVPVPMEGITVSQLIDKYLNSKRDAVARGDLEERTVNDYAKTCDVLKSHLGTRVVPSLTPDDFRTLQNKLADGRNPTTRMNDIGRVRGVFSWAFKEELIDRPVRYGDSFKKPSKKVLRVERLKRGKRMFEAAELKAMLDKATGPLRAMILLGINCGFGNMDCGTLTQQSLDLDGKWVDFGRHKTGIFRRCPLWQETVDALYEVLSAKRKPKSGYEDLVFVTRCGVSWKQKGRVAEKSKRPYVDCPISKAMARLIRDLGIHRRGLGFYALRHTFETIGQKTLDRDAVRFMMGHVPDSNDMSDVYNEEAPDDKRLLAVTDYVHAWLFGK
jgi:integrase